MIKVYVYVVGLSLLKISSQDPVGVRVLFPSGDYDSGSISTRIHKHPFKTYLIGAGEDLKAHPLLGTSFLKLTSPCGTTPCEPIKVPEHVVSLPFLTGHDLRLREGCEVGKQPSSCVPRVAQGAAAAPPISAAFDLLGDWQLLPALDCPPTKSTDPAHLPIVGGSFAQKVNFLDAAAPWNAAYSDPASLPTLGNAILLEGSVSSVDDLLTAAEKTKYLLSATDCKALTGRLPSESSCLILLAENASPASLVPTADSHFAAFYDLLTEKPAKVFLPIAAEGQMCQPIDGVGAPGPKCVPAVIGR